MKVLSLQSVGFPLNRSARRQKLELLVDPSERTFLSRATANKGRVTVTLTRDDLTDPIRLTGVPLGLRLRLRDVRFVAPQQIGLLEFFMNDESEDNTPFGIEIAYSPEQEELPWDEEDGEEVHHGDKEDTEKRGGDREEDTHAETQGRGEEAGGEEIVEVLEFKPRGIQKAVVSIRVLRDPDGRYLANYDWVLGNYSGSGATFETSGSVIEVLAALSVAVPKSLAACEVTGSADQTRAVLARRDKMEAQFAKWIDHQIIGWPEEASVE